MYGHCVNHFTANPIEKARSTPCPGLSLHARGAFRGIGKLPPRHAKTIQQRLFEL
jgi:hypothetical protein